MGLDMCLERHHYVQNFTWQKPEEQCQVTVARGGKPLPGLDPARVTYIIEEVGRWRKANAIHRWFVENVQGGRDDCGTYPVERAKLRELLALVGEALAADEPGQYLPTQSGFFFGSTDYDQGYRDDLEQTRAIVGLALSEQEATSEYYYRSSW